jgi:hypothetical protein
MGRSVSWWSWPHLRGDSRRRTAVMSVRSFGVVVTLAALVLAGAACGTRDHSDLVLRSPTSPSDSPPHPQPGTEPTRGRGSQEFIARALVLEDRSHGPQICLGGVAQSLPPQCGGPDLIGWNWKQLAGFEKRNGTRWGEFVVVGSYDPTANTLTLTRPAVPADEYDGPRFSDHGPEPAWSTPCPEPAAGWRVIDPDLTTQESQDRTRRAAQSRPDFGQLWVDQSINPGARGRVRLRGRVGGERPDQAHSQHLRDGECRGGGSRLAHNLGWRTVREQSPAYRARVGRGSGRDQPNARAPVHRDGPGRRRRRRHLG